MRKVLVVAVLSAVAAACGGGSKDNNGPTPLTGTVGGRAFTPTDVKALLVGTGSTPCTAVPVIGSVGVKALALQITSYADACSDFAAVGGACHLHQGAQAVTVVLAKLNAVPPNAEPTLGPGTYTIHDSPATTDIESAGLLRAAFAEELTTTTGDATCNGGAPTPNLSVNGGTLRIDSVSASTVTGYLSVTFQNGAGSLAGDFTASVCNATPDICQLAVGGQICTLPGTCSP